MSRNRHSSSSSSSVSIHSLLEKTDHYDKDERYMATSDLCELLKRSNSNNSSSERGSGSLNQPQQHQQPASNIFDSGTERRICTAVLRLLHDKSNDVQAVAVKTLGVLLQTVPQELVLEIADSLTDRVLDADRSELRDVYAIGLRTLVKTIPSKMGDRTSERLVGRLLEGIRASTSSAAASTFSAEGRNSENAREEIVLSCLDILTDLLGRFGATSVSVTRQHEPILQISLRLLTADDASAVVRKRAGNALGCLSVVLSDALLVSAVERLLSQIEESESKSTIQSSSSTTSNENTRALIRTMCSISGSVGHRLQQPQIDRIIPIFLRFTNPEKALTGDDDDDGNGGDDGMDDNDEASFSSSVNDASLAMANELRESCFMGFESFVQKCPSQVEPHVDKIVQAALAYMSYDPNYSYGIEENEEGMEDGADGDDDYDDEYGYDDDDEVYGDEDDDFYDDDDDDESWKVRRSAIRALTAIVEAKQDDPGFLWSRSYVVRKKKSVDCVASALVARFKEREENCRVGVLETFAKLLEFTTKKAASTTSSSTSLIDGGVLSSTVLRFAAVGDDEEMKDGDNNDVVVVDLRNKYAQAVVKSCEKLLDSNKKTKGVGERSKTHALALLSTLCKAPGGLGGHAEILSVLEHVQSLLGPGEGSNNNQGSTASSSKALKLDALSLVVAALESSNHDPKDIRKALSVSLMPQLCAAVKEQWYKVIAEALRALAAVPKFFSDIGDEGSAAPSVATQLFESVEPLLVAHDVDQEIKECALTATGNLLSELAKGTEAKQHHLTQGQTDRLTSLLLERLKNETTRIPAIKTLSAVSSSNPGLVFGEGILSESIKTMAGFLKLAARSLRQCALEALDAVVIHHGKTIVGETELFAELLAELADLVVDSDLHMSHLALRASVSALKICPDCGKRVQDDLLPNVLTLSSSPFLQDLALESLLGFLEQVVISNAVEFTDLLGMLRGRLGQASGSKHAVYNLAQCIAVISKATSPDNLKGVVIDSLKTLENSPTPTVREKNIDEIKKIQFALLVLGDIGRMVDLGSVSADVPEKLKTLYMGYFESESEELKNASSYALGQAAVGTQSVFLPAIVDSLEESNNSDKKQYLLLSALRSFIKSSYQQSGGEDIASNLPVIMPHLTTHASDSKEGVRSMVAECLGSLTCIQPTAMLEQLCKMAEDHSAIVVNESGAVDPQDAISKKNAFVCSTVAVSIKLAIAGKADASQLLAFVPRFLKLLDHKELGVRNATLLMIYSAVHHMPQLVSGVMKDQIMPELYEVATFKLKRKIDLGPFSHTVDDALPLRKAALSIFATCIENLPRSLDITAFMPVLAATLKDVEDIQLQAHQIVITMCVRQPNAVVAAVESFVEPLEKTLFKKQGTKTGTELERLIEWKKSSLRAMVALSRVEGTMNNKKFADFVQRTQSNANFLSALEAIADER
mmetsp:Transcript_28913/g.78333  ORF Transcript_28913/g.78333 Transcript_28913/m.78333 type:complete len:1439 (+) Transcript_28913:233-4549(+)